MLHPSYKELFQVMNETKEEDQIEITSRYTLALAAAKRARQIQQGSAPLVDAKAKEKNLSVAVREMNAGLVHVCKEEAN